MFKKQILSFVMLASVTSVFAHGGGSGLGTGLLVGGLAGYGIGRAGSGNADPVAHEEAREMRDERRARREAIRDMKKELRELKKDLHKAERRGHAQKAAELQNKIDRLKEDIEVERGY